MPQRTDPGIVACSMIASGLRVLDIREPYKPREIAYHVAAREHGRDGRPRGALAPPGNMGGTVGPVERSDYAMSRPSFDGVRGHIWYSDGNSGFYALKASNGVWPFSANGGGNPRPQPTPRPCPARRKRCASRRSFVIRLDRRPRSARVKVAGKRVKVRLRHGRPRARELARQAARDLRGADRRPHGGVKLRSKRRYRTCVSGRGRR